MNGPVTFIDPYAKVAWFVSGLIGAVAGAAIGAIAGGIGAYVNGKPVLSGIGYGALRGAAVGGIAGATFGLVNPALATGIGGFTGSAKAGLVIGGTISGGVGSAAGEAVAQTGERAIGNRESYSGRQIALAGAFGAATSGTFAAIRPVGSAPPLYSYSSDPLKPGAMVVQSGRTWLTPRAPGDWLQAPGFIASCSRVLSTGRWSPYPANTTCFSANSGSMTGIIAPVAPNSVQNAIKSLGGQYVSEVGISGFQTAPLTPSTAQLLPIPVSSSMMQTVQGAVGVAVVERMEQIAVTGAATGVLDPEWYSGPIQSETSF